MSITLFARGSWRVSTPFVVDQDVNHTCVAIRSFREMESEGESVYDVVYRPVGLTVAAYETDRLNAVSVITLERETGPNLFIPSSYIESYPVGTSEGYSRLVVAAEIGLLSDKVDLGPFKQKIREAIEEVVGIDDPVIEIFKTPYTGVITPQQGELIEANRQALLNNGSSVYSENKRLNNEVNRLRALNARYEQIIIDNSLVT